MSVLPTIAESFDGYRKYVIPANASAEQVRQLQAAFYGGAHVLLTALALHIGSPEVSEEQGMAELDALKAELEAFRPSSDPPPMPPPTEHTYVGPEAADVRRVLNDIGDRLRMAMPPGHGFTLIIAQFGGGGGTYYISNVDREDSHAMMREMINRQTQ